MLVMFFNKGLAVGIGSGSVFVSFNVGVDCRTGEFCECKTLVPMINCDCGKRTITTNRLTNATLIWRFISSVPLDFVGSCSHSLTLSLMCQKEPSLRHMIPSYVPFPCPCWLNRFIYLVKNSKILSSINVEQKKHRYPALSRLFAIFSFFASALDSPRAKLNSNLSYNT